MSEGGRSSYAGPIRDEVRKLSVLMPVHNQHYSLRRIVERVLAAPLDMEVELVIVDDGSDDWSIQKIVELSQQYPQIKAVFHPATLGKGAALRTAIEHMTGDVALIQEPDLAYDPAEYPRLLDPIRRNIADVVFGSRMASGDRHRVLPYWRTVGARFATWLTNILYNLSLTDAETECKVFRAEILKQTVLNANGPAVQLELAARTAQWNIRLVEVPISYMRPTLMEEPPVRLRDRLAGIWTLVSRRFFRRTFTTHDGYYILVAVRKAKKLGKWLISHFERHIGPRVLEAGSGIGTLSEFLIRRQRLVCVDYDPFYVRMIRMRFGVLENFRAEPFDLTDMKSYAWLHDERLDTIICINVLEHIEDDLAVLRKFFEVLQPGGNLILLVPHSHVLMGPTDRTLGHVRRYERKDLAETVNRAGFEVRELFGYNRLGGLGWFVSNRIFRRTHLSAGQMRWFDRLLPVARLCEYVLPFKHLSLICVAYKPGPIEEVSVPASAEVPLKIE